jgi:hypothetical protein
MLLNDLFCAPPTTCPEEAALAPNGGSARVLLEPSPSLSVT